MAGLADLPPHAFAVGLGGGEELADLRGGEAECLCVVGDTGALDACGGVGGGGAFVDGPAVEGGEGGEAAGDGGG